jgi:hypothetical protein
VLAITNIKNSTSKTGNNIYMSNQNSDLLEKYISNGAYKNNINPAANVSKIPDFSSLTDFFVFIRLPSFP